MLPNPLAVAMHCAKLTKAQLVAPMPFLPPLYWTHHGYWISARAGEGSVTIVAASSATADNPIIRLNIGMSPKHWHVSENVSSIKVTPLRTN
ncbi:MAG: hypothetical protein WA743_05475 [Pseudolabrys sp.]